MKEAKVERNSLSFLHSSSLLIQQCQYMLIRCQDGITAKPSAERVTRVEEGIHQCVAWQLRNSIIFFENAVEAQKMEHIPCAFPQHRHLLQHGNSIS